MKTLKSVIGTALALALLESTAFGWGDPGHMTIAAAAYRQLTPELKAQVFEVLKSHPDFAKWSQTYHPNPVVDLPTYAFMRCSTWPDQIRRSGNKYDHANWHFIDYPIRPPAFPMEAEEKPTDNVLVGIAECDKALSDTNADPELRAAQLSYLVHMIGDMHQPLHCSSLYTEVYTNGDRGGNDFYVMPADRPVRLHGLWDGMLGSAANPRMQFNYAIKLQTEFPRSAFAQLATNSTPKSWSLEARLLAIDTAYLKGELKGSHTTNGPAPALPEGYTKTAKALSERQAALAGYRLADEIQKHLKLGKTVPLLPENKHVATRDLPKSIGILQATNFYEEEMVVTGKVVQVTSRPGITFINLDKAGPQSPFSLVIFPDKVSAFGDLNRFTNKNVEVTGTIAEYRDKPQIILESPTQLKIVP